MPETQQLFLFVEVVYHAPEFAAGGGHEKVHAATVEMLFGFNTPQAVTYGGLKDLYRWVDEQHYDFEKNQHLSTALFDKGERLYFSKSSPINIKITTQDHLALFEAFLIKDNQYKSGEEKDMNHA